MSPKRQESDADVANERTKCRKYSEAVLVITKTYLYDFYPFKPHFYIVKLGFKGVYVIFLISAQKHRLLYSLEPPLRGGSNEYHNLYFEQKYKRNILEFISENILFFVREIFNIFE